MEQRLLLAFVLMMLVLLGSQYFLKPSPSAKAVVPPSPKATAELTEKPPVPAVSVAAQDVPAGGAQIQASSESVMAIDTDVFHIVFTNRGAAVKSWVLKRYTDSKGKPLELVNAAASSLPLPLGIDWKDRKLSFDPNTALFVATPSEDRLSCKFEFSNGRETVRKSVQFTKTSYLAEVRSEVLEGNSAVPHFLFWRGGFGDQEVFKAVAQQHAVRYDAGDNKLVTKTVKDAKNGPLTESGNYTFGGLEDNFFAAVALPGGPSNLELRTYSDDLSVPGESKPVPFIGGGISTGAQNQFALFVGPKDIDILRAVSPKLGQIVDWGFFGIIAKPLFLCLNYVNDHFTNNYGWAIILVTFAINVLLFPFKFTSLKSARKMQALQPRIQLINAKYANVGLRDPRKADQNTEVMALYKEAGVNPVGGCLPMLLQLPFFYAFYRVLNIAIELRGAPWLWVSNLSQAETIPIHLLPLILVATQFLSQKMTPAAGVDPNQQKMMMFMPLMFGVMFYTASSGLVLYWLTGNLVGIAQQLITNKFMPPIAPAAPLASKAPVKKIKK